MKAVITGATKGIGRAIAIKFAQHGYDLVLVARGLDELEKFRQELTLYGNAVFIQAADCSIKEEVYAFLNSTAIDFDDVAVLVNNVGIFLPGSLLDEDDETFEKQQHLNVNASYYISKFFGKKNALSQAGPHI
ncbi:SDR family oxidoreductase [Pedobacter sp.]|uniref:SDR family NAD(P)-dependent oxidoreductase n=1 Tax=Pedobacter sp. TaxID=1411316 RepID=UPI0031D6C5DE